MTSKKPALFYTGYVLAWTLLVSIAGAIVGAIIYPLGGKLLGMKETLAELARSGAHDLGFIAFIWAPGIGLVLAFRHAYRRRQSSSRSTTASVRAEES